MGHLGISPWSYQYVTNKGMKVLKEDYKYSGEDLSLTSKYLLQPYWRWLVEFLPETVAPNTVTMTGLLVNTTAFLMAVYCSNGYADHVPAFACYWASFSLFFYQTLDALDGKQARRTGCSGPLGELFDHGCDALSTPMVGLTYIAVCGDRGVSWMNFAVVFAVVSGMFAAQFEQYVTGTLTLGVVNGPVEGILLNVLFLFMAGFLGPEFARNTVPLGCMGIDYNLWELTSYTFLLIALIGPGSGVLAYFYTSTTFSGVPVGGKNKSMGHRLTHWYLFFTLAGLVFYLAWRDPEVMLTKMFAPLMLCFGFSVSNVMTRLCVNRMAAEDSGYFTPLVVLVMPALAVVFPEHANCILYTWLAGNILGYLHLALSLCHQLSRLFGRYTFSVQRRPQSEWLVIGKGN